MYPFSNKFRSFQEKDWGCAVFTTNLSNSTLAFVLLVGVAALALQIRASWLKKLSVKAETQYPHAETQFLQVVVSKETRTEMVVSDVGSRESVKVGARGNQTSDLLNFTGDEKESTTMQASKRGREDFPHQEGRVETSSLPSQVARTTVLGTYRSAEADCSLCVEPSYFPILSDMDKSSITATPMERNFTHRQQSFHCLSNETRDTFALRPLDEYCNTLLGEASLTLSGRKSVATQMLESDDDFPPDDSIRCESNDGNSLDDISASTVDTRSTAFELSSEAIEDTESIVDDGMTIKESLLVRSNTPDNFLCANPKTPEAISFEALVNCSPVAPGEYHNKPLLQLLSTEHGENDSATDDNTVQSAGAMSYSTTVEDEMSLEAEDGGTEEDCLQFELIPEDFTVQQDEVMDDIDSIDDDFHATEEDSIIEEDSFYDYYGVNRTFGL